MKPDEKINYCGIVTEKYCRTICPNSQKYPNCDRPTKDNEVQEAQKWIEQNCWKTDQKLSSYDLRYDIQRKTKKKVSNGSVIEAAMSLGYMVSQIPPSLNCFFNRGIKNECNKRY